MNRIKESIIRYINGFVEGDIKTRLSYLVMGSGSFLRKQYVRGFAYLAFQVITILYFFGFGLKYVSKLTTLGTLTSGRHFDESRGIYIYTQGDNSMLILLFGVLTVFILISLLYVYLKNIKNAIDNQALVEANNPLPTFREDVEVLLNSKFHISIMSIPLLTTFAFTILPLIFMILIAFTNYDKMHQPPATLFTWVGLENFKNMLFGSNIVSGTFFNLFIWTFVWAFFATFLNYILGMMLAMLINSKEIKIKKFWRTIFVITIAIPQFVSLLLMAQMLSKLGAFNVILEHLGIITANNPIRFLEDGTLAKITVIVINCWVGIPYTMLITSGILMNIPQDMYESARIDGASAWVQFRKITLPYMLNVTAPYLITQFIGNINNFNVIYLLTGGGPNTLEYYQAGKTDLLVTWLYKLTMNDKNYALASTLGIIIFAISATLSLVIFRNVTKEGKEGQFQ